MNHSSNKIKFYNEKNWMTIPQLTNLNRDLLEAISIVSRVLPFRVNNYVLEELINWKNVPEDPIYQLVFPQKGMLKEEHYKRLYDTVYGKKANPIEVNKVIDLIRMQLNPHPSLQKELNSPFIDGKALDGMQHKYSQTLLFFPKQMQTCHSYCSFCFRWAQFIGNDSLKFASNEREQLFDYLAKNKQISDLLITGGDPMIAKTHHIASYIEPLLNDKRFSHINNIRIGTKSLTYWPYRFLTDEDADDLLRLFEKVVASGKQLAFMAHYNHWLELEPSASKQAIKRVLATGAIIRGQGPLLKHINDDATVIKTLWDNEVKLGVIPYYLFVERDTGAQPYFELPIVKVWEIYREAISHVSGLARTVRGPSMTITAGKVELSGVSTINEHKVFVLRFIQARDPKWVNRPFFAKFDPNATFFHSLVPAFGENKFFFEDDNQLLERTLLSRWAYDNNYGRAAAS